MPMGKRTQLAKGAIVFPNGTILKLIVMPNSPGEMSEGSLVNKTENETQPESRLLELQQTR